MKKIGNYVVKEELGRGAHGKVCKGEHIEKGGLVAIKILASTKAFKSGCSASNEVLALKASNHPNVVQFIDIQSQGDEVFIIMEYVPRKIDIQEGGCSEALAQRYIGDILSALDYLHGKGIRQGDVKPDNCLLSLEGVLKLTDFGISVLTTDDEPGKCLGTPNYMAPEQFDKGSCLASDIWAVGCTLIHFRTGHAPYHDLNHFAVQRLMAEGAPPPTYGHASTLEREFLVQTFVKDPASRPSAAQLLRHSWLTVYVRDADRDRRRDSITYANGSPVAAAAADADEFQQNGLHMPTVGPAFFKLAAERRRPTSQNRLPVAAALTTSSAANVVQPETDGGACSSSAAAATATGAAATNVNEGSSSKPQISAALAVIQNGAAPAGAAADHADGASALSGATAAGVAAGVDDFQFPDDMDVKQKVLVSLSEQPDSVKQSGLYSAFYSSIAEAVDQSDSGTAILVESGSYQESLSFYTDKTLFVRGLGAKGSVRVRGDGRGRCLLVSQGTVWFSRVAFKLTEGFRINEAIHVHGEGQLNLRECWISGADVGIFIKGSLAQLKLEICDVNRTKTAVSLVDGARARILHSQVTDNRIGLWAKNAGAIELRSSEFTRNTQHGCLLVDGGAQCQLTAVECLFQENRRGLDVSGAGVTLKLATSTFTDNGSGALILRGQTTGTVKHCQFMENRTVTVELAGGPSAPTFSENTFSDTPVGVIVRAAPDADSSSASAAAATAAAPAATALRRRSKDTGPGPTTRSSSARRLLQQQQPTEDILNPAIFLENTFTASTDCGFLIYVTAEAAAAAYGKPATFAHTVQTNNLWQQQQQLLEEGGATASEQQQQQRRPQQEKVRLVDVSANAGTASGKRPPRTPMAKMRRAVTKLGSSMKNSAMKKKRKPTSAGATGDQQQQQQQATLFKPSARKSNAVGTSCTTNSTVSEPSIYATASTSATTTTTTSAAAAKKSARKQLQRKHAKRDLDLVGTGNQASTTTRKGAPHADIDDDDDVENSSPMKRARTSPYVSAASPLVLGATTTVSGDPKTMADATTRAVAGRKFPFVVAGGGDRFEEEFDFPSPFGTPK